MQAGAISDAQHCRLWVQRPSTAIKVLPPFGAQASPTLMLVHRPAPCRTVPVRSTKEIDAYASSFFPCQLHSAIWISATAGAV